MIYATGKRCILLTLLLIFLIPKQSQSQDNGAAVAAIGAGILAIGAGIAAIEQMKEQAELTATQWVLAHEQDMTSFSLKTLDFEGKKLKDMSAVSVITFKIQEFTPNEDPVLDGTKYVLLGFTSNGWINEYGIDFEKIRWFLIDREEWISMMTSYVSVASGSENGPQLRQAVSEGKIVNRGVKVKNKNTIHFYKLSGDMYVVTDYSKDMKFIYNERSLGIFLKETQDLVQIKRGSIIEIQDFFFDED